MKKTSKTMSALCAALIAGSMTTFAVAQTTHDPATEPMTHADNKAAKEQAKANKKADVAQAKADKKKTESQSEANEAAADANLKNAKKSQ
jgi:sortase (surface protein transpeptidase)